ncbi:hypothetical protein [Dactylosporangium aurantiacum]|uniref:hypothetical protein n=1 Tax=Dactylosporangium aurantiacum TaxID=35754 RepID=UPI00311AC208
MASLASQAAPPAAGAVHPVVICDQPARVPAAAPGAADWYNERVADDDWQSQRARAVAHHGAELDRRRAAEAAEASGLVERFVADARAAGLPTAPLRARSYNGRSYRTPLRGWYLNSDRTIAVGDDGRYYSLLVPPSATGWLTGVTPQPQAPRLIVGEGARDGESLPLARLLQQRLEAG